MQYQKATPQATKFSNSWQNRRTVIFQNLFNVTIIAILSQLNIYYVFLDFYCSTVQTIVCPYFNASEHCL